mgnify:CR=1 FL=1
MKSIIEDFKTHVKNVKIETGNTRHCGKEGHWLEKKMGVKPNQKNEPDIEGYEMKKHSKGKITLGDYSASEYAFSKHGKRNRLNDINHWTDDDIMSRHQFIKMFGSQNPLKHNRYSWSGSCVPKYNEWNDFGQTIDIQNDDIHIIYSRCKDTRTHDKEILNMLNQEQVVIALWTKAKMKACIERKFNNKGFFICKKQGDSYNKICFGKCFTFEHFISQFRTNKIIFDSGMYMGNNRNYSLFRGNQDFWESLIIEEY